VEQIGTHVFLAVRDVGSSTGIYTFSALLGTSAEKRTRASVRIPARAAAVEAVP
jgi:hypothetical protein